MKQKFRRFTFVHVCKEMPPERSHSKCDFDGIVNGTYSQEYGGRDVYLYDIYQLEKGKVVDCIAWYKEHQLTELPKQDRKKAEEMIEKYNLRCH